MSAALPAKLRIDLKLHHGHGRNGAKEMRIKQLKQRSGDLRKLLVELVLDASGD